MKLLTVITTVAMVAGSASASFEQAARHPAGHLFIRDHNRRGPVELYTGGDPQAHLVRRDPVELDADSFRRRGSDYLNIYDLVPRHLQDDKGQYLAKRQAATTSPGTGTAYPPAGPDPPKADTLPKAWVDKLNAAKKAGLIPDIPPSKENAAGTVDYPAGTDMSKVQSWTIQKQFNGDIYQAPDNAVAFGIDDGPTPNGTGPYLDIMKQENITATHFLIGSAVMWNSDVLKTLANATPKQNLGVHTWSHTLQTTKTDLEVLGDLGWTMQIIYDYTGLIPMYFRPPEGDVDNRVRAIAKYVLGMQTVMWTVDADDWCLRQTKGSAKGIGECDQTAPNFKAVQEAQVGWASPKKNNTGFITLNHETTDQAAKAFSALVKAAKKENWNLEGAVPNLQGLPWYTNAYGPNDAGTKQDNILPMRDFINVTDPTAAKGSNDAPKLGNWAKTAAVQNPKVAAQTTGSNDSGSGGSGSKTSGASHAIAALPGLLLGTAASAFAFALLV